MGVRVLFVLVELGVSQVVYPLGGGYLALAGDKPSLVIPNRYRLPSCAPPGEFIWPWGGQTFPCKS